MIRKLVEKLGKYFLMLFLLCFLLSAVGAPGFVFGHEIVVAVYHGFLTLVTGKSSINIPKIKK